MRSIEDRLVQLLQERGFTPTLHPRDPVITESVGIPNWTVTFRSGDQSMNVITALTPVMELWWLEHSIGEEAPKTQFEAWMNHVSELFMAEFGMGPDDFEDYDWWAEYDGENTPRDSFEEWKLLNQTDLGG